jgi:hypothetical protein
VKKVAGQKETNIRQRKWKRLRKIMDNLHEPKSIEEIEELVFKERNIPYNSSGRNRRNTNNYLHELKEIGLIEYDKKTRFYQKAGVRKRVFKSKVDKEQAVRHAKYLVLSDEERSTQRYDYDYLKESIVDLIVFNDKFNHGDSYLDKCVYQHIESGYHEIFVQLKKYKKLLIKNGLTENGLPKARSKLGLATFLQEGQELSEQEKELEKNLQEIDALKGLITGLIDRRIIFPVEEGQPLLGECDQCPHLKFSTNARAEDRSEVT